MVVMMTSSIAAIMAQVFDDHREHVAFSSLVPVDGVGLVAIALAEVRPIARLVVPADTGGG